MICCRRIPIGPPLQPCILPTGPVSALVPDQFLPYCICALNEGEELQHSVSIPRSQGQVRLQRPAAPAAQGQRRQQRQAERQDHARTCLEKEAARGGEQEMECRASGGETVSVRRGRAREGGEERRDDQKAIGQGGGWSWRAGESGGT